MAEIAPNAEARIDLGEAGAGGAGNNGVSLIQLQVVATGNQLQASAEVAPISVLDTVNALGVVACDPNGSPKCSANVSIFGGGGSAGTNVVCSASFNTYNRQTDGTTFVCIAQGEVNHGGVSRMFSFAQTFTV